MEARAAIRHYCNYQERCHKEVRNKLYELGCKAAEVDQLMTELIEQDLLNEERYARAVARGKFRLKQWGRNKIVQQLKANAVSAYCIKKALTEIDEEEYAATLQKLAERKWEDLRTEKRQPVRTEKLFRYLLQKGYEGERITETFKQILTTE